jgi:hypothetical protein
MNSAKQEVRFPRHFIAIDAEFFDRINRCQLFSGF